jgi:hypothetical protein
MDTNLTMVLFGRPRWYNDTCDISFLTILYVIQPDTIKQSVAYIITHPDAETEIKKKFMIHPRITLFGCCILVWETKHTSVNIIVHHNKDAVPRN